MTEARRREAVSRHSCSCSSASGSGIMEEVWALLVRHGNPTWACKAASSTDPTVEVLGNSRTFPLQINKCLCINTLTLALLQELVLNLVRWRWNSQCEGVPCWLCCRAVRWGGVRWLPLQFGPCCCKIHSQLDSFRAKQESWRFNDSSGIHSCEQEWSGLKQHP